MNPIKEVVEEHLGALIEKAKNNETLCIVKEMSNITGEVIHFNRELLS